MFVKNFSGGPNMLYVLGVRQRCAGTPVNDTDNQWMAETAIQYLYVGYISRPILEKLIVKS